MNKHILILILSLACFCHNIGYCQTDSITTTKNTFLKKEIVPLSLIGTGLYVNYAGGSLGKVNLQNSIQNGLNFHTKADNYLQFSPLAILATADAFGIKTTNNIKVQAKNIVIITTTNYVLVQAIKAITNETRPNGGKHSFYSGHTSNAFALAGILHHELKSSYPFLSYTGYALATTTGVFRVLNNKHWVSDVLAGAGMGMLITDVFYRIQSKDNSQKKQKKITSIFVPTIKDKSFGISGILYF